MTATDLSKLESELLAEIAGAADLGALDAVRIGAIGKKGRVSELMAKLGSLPADERKAFGQSVNTLKGKVSDALDARKSVLDGAALEAARRAVELSLDAATARAYAIVDRQRKGGSRG